MIAILKARLPDDWRLALVNDVHWVISHSWSLRFVFIAFLLSGLEVFLPLIMNSPASRAQQLVFASTIALTTGAAFVARLVAQKRAHVSVE